ncbi:MAG TPA: S1 RNA-binding domain-containing protein, partial [Beijerinckiaceae bacterium]
RISGVTRAGLFIKLADTGADGFVPAATIGADYYRFDERRHAMVGDRTGETYRLGDTVEVKLVEAAPVAGALRFELLSEGAKDTAKGSRKDTKGPPGRSRSKREPERRTTPRLKSRRESGRRSRQRAKEPA